MASSMSGGDGKPQMKVRLPIAPNPVRGYVVRAGILDGAQEAAEAEA